MTHRVRSAFNRFLALCAVVVVATSFVAPLAAQQTSGKIEGTVTDQAGVPLANAQVFVVGTSFGAVTSDKGYYFINNVPVGTYLLRAQFIGYAPTEVRDVRVLGGQTITQNVKLTPSAIQVGGVSIEASNPIVPRDQVTSKSTITGATINSLPVDDVNRVISLQPGVVEGVSGGLISARRPAGGSERLHRRRPGAQSGVRRQLYRPEPDLLQHLGRHERDRRSIGDDRRAWACEFGDAQSGVISFTTRAGGSKLSGGSELRDRRAVRRLDERRLEPDGRLARRTDSDLE